MKLRILGSGLVNGLKVTGIHVFRRPVTRPYPERHAYTPERFRGRHRLVVEDCVVCQACARICPVNCLTVEGHRGDDRRFVLTAFTIDYGLCMFCDLCVEACPPHCLTMGPDFEMATTTRPRLVEGVAELARNAGASS
ncbi:MAG: NADH-quinone oxidoreductase subunit I [Sulfobacillus sp.]|nr:NADH-quinone oxidoreductase subunit I [Sulfobacillus sp.]